MKLIRSFSAAALLLALLIVAPWALVRFGQVGSLLELDWLRVWTQADDGRLFLGVISLLAWLAWALLAATIIFEIVGVVSRRRIRLRLPGTGWLRPSVAGLVIAATGLPLAATAGPAAHVGPPAPSLDSLEALGSLETPDRGRPASASAVTDLNMAGGESRPASVVRHVIQPQDDLWTLAEHYLGSGSRWREIAQANPHVDAEAGLVAGHRLVIPVDDASSQPDPGGSTNQGPDASRAPSGGASASQTDARAEKQSPTVIVRRGDSLWHLAEEHLGDATRWPEIYALNRDQIANPDEIDVGWTLTLPHDSLHSTVSSSSAGAPSTSPPSSTTDKTEAEHGTAPPSPGSTPGESGAETGTAHDATGDKQAAEAPAQGATAPKPTAPARPTEPMASSATAPGTGTGQPAAEEQHSPAPTPSEWQSMDASSLVAGLIGSIGAGLAAAVLTQLGWRRWSQRSSRGVGRRVASVSGSALRFETALARRAVDWQPPGSSDPRTPPTEVLVGWAEDERPITVDLEAERLLQLQAERHGSDDSAAAIITSLLCSPWSSEVELVVVGHQAEWATVVDTTRNSAVCDTSTGLRHLLETAAARRVGLGTTSLEEARADPNRSAAFTPLVYVFCEPLTVAELSQAADALDLGHCGVSVVSAVQAAAALPQVVGRVLRIDMPADDREPPSATLTGESTSFLPQLVSTPARHALIELFHTADSDETSPAPWWSDEDTWPDNVTPFPHRSNRSSEEPALDAWSPDDITTPTLLLLGPVELRGTRGPEPSRSRHQCEECCAWLLENPGGTPTQMSDDLIIAESTRRSNMSRLRTWLGSDADDLPYLPDAYTGRLSLHDDVTSDWEQFNIVLAGGVNRASPAALEKALSMVRGEPFGGTTTWEWTWAGPLASDMVSMISDAAVTLALGALGQGDIDLARWAVSQGQLASPTDEHLAVTDIRVEHAAGNHERVQKLVRDLTRRARTAGHDLSDESVRAIQHVMSLSGRRAQAD